MAEPGLASSSDGVQLLGHGGGGPQVDVEHLVPGVVVDEGHRDAAPDAGRVDEAPDGAELGQGAPCRGLERVDVLVTSTLSPTARTPNSSMHRRATRRAAAPSRSQSATARPTWANASAVAWPMPDPPPVMTTPESGRRGPAARAVRRRTAAGPAGLPGPRSACRSGRAGRSGAAWWRAVRSVPCGPLAPLSVPFRARWPRSGPATTHGAYRSATGAGGWILLLRGG